MSHSLENKFKPISISLSPNVQKDDVSLALKLLFQPWKWKQGKAIKQLEDEFKKYLGVKYAFSFNSGRSAFFAILKALELPEHSDVFLQAFTCNAVPNPILWAKLNPVYVDCSKENFNIDIEDLRNKINGLTRANKGFTGDGKCVLVVQHTFGLPVNMDEIKQTINGLIKTTSLQTGVCKDVVIVEDCAHALGAEYSPSHHSSTDELVVMGNGKKLGTFGKAGFFSFSRDKVISCVYGGIAVTNDDEIGKKLGELQKQFGMPSNDWILQQISHPILLHFVILPFYNFFDLGKVFLVGSQWMRILSKAVSWKEKRGLRPNYFPKALPNALAEMALHQFNKLDNFYRHRKKLAEFYYRELQNTSFKLPNISGKQSFLRFAVQHPKAHEIIYEAWNNQNILIGDWYTTPIAPDDTKMSEMKYESGSCKNAEELAKTTLNLPTHINISMDDAQRIVNFLKKYTYPYGS